MDPLAGIKQVCGRTTAESISEHEALSAYTLGSAYAEGKETEKGILLKRDVRRLLCFKRKSDYR